MTLFMLCAVVAFGLAGDQDLDMGRERAVHRTLVGDLHEPLALIARERPVQVNHASNPIYPHRAHRFFAAVASGCLHM